MDLGDVFCLWGLNPLCWIGGCSSNQARDSDPLPEANGNGSEGTNFDYSGSCKSDADAEKQVKDILKIRCFRSFLKILGKDPKALFKCTEGRYRATGSYKCGN